MTRATDWNLIDRTIAAVFPAWGLARLRARALAHALRTTVEDVRAYRDQNLGPRGEIEMNRRALLAVGRRLVATNDFAHGVVNSITDNIVGPGLRFEAKVKFADGRPKTAKNQELEDDFWAWAEAVDSTGRISWGQTLRMLESESWVAGESFLVMSLDPRRRRGDRIVPLMIDVIEAERVDSPNDPATRAGGPEIFDGIELAGDGRVEAYHILDHHPADEASFRRPRRVPADRVIHHFLPQRPGQLRGLSRFGPVAASLKSLAEYLNFELTKAKTASALAILWKRANKFGGGIARSENQTTADAVGNAYGHLYGGTIIQGGPQDELSAVSSGITSDAFDPFVRLVLRRIAAGLNISYELLARDFSAHNFSSIRQSFLEDRRHWEPRQQALVSICHRVWADFVVAGKLGGVSSIVNLGQRDAEQVEFHPPGFDWVDPLVEREADALGIKCGLQNIKQTAAKHGYDWQQNLDDLADVRRQFDELGLDPPEELFQKEEMAIDAEEPAEELSRF